MGIEESGTKQSRPGIYNVLKEIAVEVPVSEAYEEQMEVTRSVGIKNLAEHSIVLDETATTHDIVTNIAKIPSLKYANSVVGLFKGARFPENTELIIDIPNCSDLSEMLRGTKSLNKVKISGNVDGNLVLLDFCFTSGSAGKDSLTEIDFTDFILRIGSMNSCFNQRAGLKKILGVFDLSELVEGQVLMLAPVAALEEIRFKENTIKNRVTATACKNLSVESAKSILLGLVNLADTEKAFTLAVSLSAVTWEKLAADTTAPNNMTWEEYVTSKGWNM